MDFTKEYAVISTPKIYRRNNKPCYFDTYRKRLIEITPEETVRQKIATYFEQNLGVPHDMLMLEVPMCWYVEKAQGRADIIIHQYNQNDNIQYPLAVIECKAPDVYITDQTFDQAIRYADCIGANYIIVTNGNEIEIGQYSEEELCYLPMERLMTYEELTGNLSLVQDISAEIRSRLTFDELQDKEKLQEYNYNNIAWIFGTDTLDSLKSFVVNLYDAFMDVRHTLPLVQKEHFEIIEDLGVRYLGYSNAGGGHYVGNYRSFLIKDPDENAQIISFSIFGTDPQFRNEKRKSYSSLVVAIDQYKSSHNVLQYNIDSYAQCSTNLIEFYHDGRISSRKTSELLEFMKNHNSQLINSNNEIFLGSIKNNILLYLDEHCVSQFVYNLIEYTIIREEFHTSTK